MQWSDINRAPSSRTLRRFSGLGLLIFGGLACWHYFRLGHDTSAVVFAALAVALGPLGLAFPQALKWVYVGWMVAAFPIGWVVSRLILSTLFFGIFTPVAFVFRLVGRDALQRYRRPQQDSCWIPKATATDPRSYFRQS